MNTQEEYFVKYSEDMVGPLRKKKRRIRAILHAWTEDEIVQLIQAVETKPELWKASHKWYKNRNKKNAAWRDIEENVFNRIIKLTELTAKWHNLRVQYKTYAVKYKMKPSISGRANINKWKHFDPMNFIDTKDTSLPLTETSFSNLPPVIVPTDSESTTSSVQSSCHVRQPTSTSSASSHTPKPIKLTNSANSANSTNSTNATNATNDNLDFQGIPHTIDNLKKSKSDEFNIFGQFVVAEIVRLPSDLQRQQLKRTIQRAIMDFNENIEQKQSLAATLGAGASDQLLVVDETLKNDPLTYNTISFSNSGNENEVKIELENFTDD